MSTFAVPRHCGDVDLLRSVTLSQISSIFGQPSHDMSWPGQAGRATWPLTTCPRARAPLPQNRKRRAEPELPIQRPDQAVTYARIGPLRLTRPRMTPARGWCCDLATARSNFRCRHIPVREDATARGIPKFPELGTKRSPRRSRGLSWRTSAETKVAHSGAGLSSYFAPPEASGSRPHPKARSASNIRPTVQMIAGPARDR